jgi:hypothetical protein
VNKKLDFSKIDILIQYSLALASQEDDFKSRSLGPIHLVKYVYLADLIHAERKGETFTGVNWQFYKFGPWSPEVFSRIDPALAAIGAEKKTLPSAFSEDDYYRYAIQHEPTPEMLEKNIPVIILGKLKKYVHEFSSDTPALLHHVYLTKPMLTAAPGELLDFSTLRQHSIADEIGRLPEEALSNKAKKRRAEHIRSIKASVQERLAERIQKKKVAPKGYTPPRYDEVFEQGQSWLESLAGEPIKEKEGEVRFPEEIWKSQFRYDPDLS